MTAPSRQSGEPTGAVEPSDRLLAEAVRAYERQEAAPPSTEQADAAARACEGDLERKIIARAAAVPYAESLRRALAYFKTSIGWMLLVMAIIVSVSGAVAARASLVPVRGDEVNIFLALLALLGLQTFALLLWFIIMVLRPAALSTGSLGGAVLGLARKIASRLHRGRASAAAIEAGTAVHAGGAVGRWTLSAISHSLWLLFNAFALAIVIVLLSARHYTFVWETTILDEQAYTNLTHAISWLPEKMGFAAPSGEQIASSQSHLDPDAAAKARTAWSGLLVGSLVMYGLAPRLLLAGLSLSWRRRALKRYRLDVAAPGFSHLAQRLAPSSHRVGVVIPDDPGAERAAIDEPVAPRAARDLGDPAIVGLEVDAPATGWPPRVATVAFADLGFVETSDDMRRVLTELGESATEPRTLVIVCALTTTPDRGVRALLARFVAAVSQPISLVLTAGQRLRSRTDAAGMTERVNDWRALAADAGVPEERIIEIDLDHATDESLGALALLLADDASQSPVTDAVRAGLLDKAFDEIVKHADKWSTAPTPEQIAELHRAVGRVYRADKSLWRRIVGVPCNLAASAPDMSRHLQGAAQRVTGLLPPRLLDSRWLAAGAAVGAVGSVVAATLVTPAAIVGLPVWSAFGAAIGAVLGGKRKAAPDEASETDALAETDDEAFDRAIRAAALLAMLLELQRFDEADITRVLDRTLPASDAPVEHRTEAVRVFLDDLHERLSDALRAEGMS